MRSTLTSLSVVFLSFVFTAPVWADCYGDSVDEGYGYLVKTSFTESFYVADDLCNRIEEHYVDSFNMVVEDFVAADPAPVAWPNADSGVRTEDILTNEWLDNLDDIPGTEGLFSAESKSLKDIGFYLYQFGGTWADEEGESGLMEPTDIYLGIGNEVPQGDIEVTDDAHVGDTVTLDADVTDPDGGNITRYKWAITSRPSGSTAELEGPDDDSSELPINDHLDIGDWTARFRTADNEGEMVEASVDFTIKNQDPDISIEGPDEVAATDPLELTCGPDSDPDGEELHIKWDIVKAPEDASPGVGNNVHTGTSYSIETSYTEIGDWEVRCHAEDAHGGSDSDTLAFTVIPKLPEIDLQGETDIDVGDDFYLETTITEDAYGEPLDFNWRLIQVPESAGEELGDNFSNTSEVNFRTQDSDAGTWGFRLTVTDVIGETTEEDIYVLVDGQPVVEFDAPVTAGNALQSIEMDGSASIDPDTPGEAPDYEHLYEDALVISNGLVYTWSLKDVPAEYYPEYFQGPVTDVLGIGGNGPVLTIPAGKLKPGSWLFALDIKDGEENHAYAEHQLTVLDGGLPPVAYTDGPQLFQVTPQGVALTNMSVGGVMSFDSDNLLSGPYSDGVGITNYSWSIPIPAVGCSVPPVLAEGPSANILTLYTAGQTVPPECQGVHAVQLTVTDDDVPTPLTATDLSVVMIGNCEGDICIDRPTETNPQFVKRPQDADVMIYYTINSIHYDVPAYVNGLWVEMEVFHESDSLNPVSSDVWDLDMLPSEKGSVLAFNWPGFTNSNGRPLPGKYTIKLSLAGVNGALTGGSATAVNAIWIKTLDLGIQNTATKYLDRGKLPGAEQLRLPYNVMGNLPGETGFDQLQLVVKNKTSGAVVFTRMDSAPFNGTVTWDGNLGAGVIISTGVYEATLEMFEEGESMGRSLPWTITVFAFRITSSATPVRDILPGSYMTVNKDDDNANSVTDSTENVPSDDDFRTVTVMVVPAMAGQLTLSSTNNAIKFYSGPGKTGPLGTSETFTSPNQLPSGPLTMEATLPGQTSVQASLVDTNGLAIGTTFFVTTVIDIRVTDDSNGNFVAEVDDERIHFVLPGLWDGAFRLAGDNFGAINSLYNENDQVRRAASGNPENFIGRDSRRFYVEINDASANGNPALIEELVPNLVEWYTILSTSPRANDSFPGDASLHLTETGPNTGVFTSEALMLVSDVFDENQPTNTGLASHPGMAARGEDNHRLRMISSVGSLLGVNYSPAGSGRDFERVLPVFLRSPETRRLMRVRVFNFSDPLNLMVPGTSPDVIARTMETMAAVYRHIGIDVRFQYNPATDDIQLPQGSLVDLDHVRDFTGSFGTLLPSADMLNLISLVRAVDPASPSNADTVYVCFVGGFVGANRGEALPDGYNPNLGGARNFVFIAGSQPQLDYVPAHETGHLLTNGIGLTEAEVEGTATGWEAGGHYGPVQVIFNLMYILGVHNTPHNVNDSRRLWNDTDVHEFPQIDRIFTSRFIKTP